jgi:hypothetical protein
MSHTHLFTITKRKFIAEKQKKNNKIKSKLTKIRYLLQLPSLVFSLHLKALEDHSMNFDFLVSSVWPLLKGLDYIYYISK